MYRLRVREIAEQKGLSRTQLSYLSQIQYETINGIFKNDRRDVSLTTLLKLAKALQVDITELYELTEDSDSPSL